MKYILGLAFEYKHYKKPAVIRTYADNHLIDELELSQDIRRKGNASGSATTHGQGWGHDEWGVNQWWEPRLEKWGRFYYGKDRISLCEKLFTYEIDERVLDKTISIEVINDDNNYTNGFMTQYSWVIFDMVFLMPKRYFEDLGLLSKEKPDVLGRRHRRSSIHDKSAVLEWQWPQCDELYYDKESETYDKQIETNFLARGLRIGKSFRYDFDLEEWGGMKVIKPKNIGKKYLSELNCHINEIFLAYYMGGKLINRYNEDNRSHNA